MRHGESGQPGLGLGAAAGGAFVADLATGAGAGAGKRRDRGRMVVRLALDRECGVFDASVRQRRVDGSACMRSAHAIGDHCGIVVVGRQRVRRRGRVRVLDHLEQRLRLLVTVDAPTGVEHLVPAVLGIRLREHHQFGVGRVATETRRRRRRGSRFHRRSAPGRARHWRRQRHAGVTAERDARQRSRAIRGGTGPRLQRRNRTAIASSGRADARSTRVRAAASSAASPLDAIAHAALDAVQRQTGTTQDVGGLARPRRNGAKPWQHQHLVAGQRRARRAGVEQLGIALQAPRHRRHRWRTRRAPPADRRRRLRRPAVQPADRAGTRTGFRGRQAGSSRKHREKWAERIADHPESPCRRGAAAKK